ncbi:MAG: hypothetical protein JRJ19_05395 [Deltaproteobacteria bacterium]|nr:hypothetical protein [Deltaproteobacteria bacterium]MBW1871477.1 hypothetical protein [Deltaproteobacteria bacterium]
MKIVKHVFLICLLALSGLSCGHSDDAYLALKVNSPPDGLNDIRRFPPYMPSPLRVHVEIFKSTNLDPNEKPTLDLDQAWDELESDPVSGNKFMLITISANEDKDFEYLLRLSSIIEDGMGGLIVDECGVIGQIVAAKGAKVRLDMTTHLGACKILWCQKDQDCVGEDRYCLSFECQGRTACPAEDCPDGAYCDGFGFCAGACTADTECEDNFRCCQGMCSAHCPI